jgi:hypothetical protein
MTSSSTTSSRDHADSLELIDIKPGKKFSLATLKDLLPDVESLLFFAKVYKLDAQQVRELLLKVLDTDLARALFGEGHVHSNSLQCYIIGGYDEDGDYYPGIVTPAEKGDVVFDPDVPKGEILPQMWEQLEVTVASSIQAVAEKLEDVVSMLPGKQGTMVFKSMQMMNAKRPVIGDYHIAQCKGHIDEVIDVSLVNRPTYLAECVGQLADKVSPILIGSTGYVLV